MNYITGGMPWTMNFQFFTQNGKNERNIKCVKMQMVVPVNGAPNQTDGLTHKLTLKWVAERVTFGVICLSVINKWSTTLFFTQS